MTFTATPTMSDTPKPDPDSFSDHFSGVASDYARFRPRYPTPLFDFIASVAPAREHAWDCATGSGQAAVELAERFDRVTATDASAEQIASAKPHPHVTYLVEPAEKSSLPDTSVDLVAVATGIHWFNRPAFFSEVERVLRPNGVLAAWCYDNQQIEHEEVERMMVDYYHNIVGEYWPPERKLVEQGYSTIDFPFEKIDAPPFAIEASLTLDELLGYMRTWSARVQFRAERGFDPLPELAERIARVWGSPDARYAVHWPIALHVRRKDV